MIAGRIRIARLANRLSLQQLADRLVEYGTETTRATLSNYEIGKIVPSEPMLEKLAVALGVTTEYFQMADWEDFSLSLFSGPGLVPARMQELTAYMQLEIERYRNLDRLLEINCPWNPPERVHITRFDPDEIEAQAQRVRENLDLGSYPIASVCGILENRGFYLLSAPSEFTSNLISGYELSGMQPFIFYQLVPFVDEFRQALMHEFGRFYMDVDPFCEAKVLDYFSRAILMPSTSAYADFGEHRNEVSYEETTYAKQKYGMSRRQMIRRLHDLHIVTDEYYAYYHAYIMQHAFLWRDNNTSMPLNIMDAPLMYNMKFNRAVSEGLITQDRNRFF